MRAAGAAVAACARCDVAPEEFYGPSSCSRWRPAPQYYRDPGAGPTDVCLAGGLWFPFARGVVPGGMDLCFDGCLSLRIASARKTLATSGASECMPSRSAAKLISTILAGCIAAALWLHSVFDPLRRRRASAARFSARLAMTLPEHIAAAARDGDLETIRDYFEDDSDGARDVDETWTDDNLTALLLCSGGAYGSLDSKQPRNGTLSPVPRCVS